MKKFDELTSSELWKLRNEITLNSIYIADYENSFRFNAKDVCNFFDGFIDYLSDEAEEDGITDFEVALEKYDNEEFLYTWFLCFDDLSWVKSDIKVFRFSQTYKKTVTWREYYDIEAESLEEAIEKVEECDGDLDDCEDAEFVEVEQEEEYDAEEFQRRVIDTIYDPNGEEIC